MRGEQLSSRSDDESESVKCEGWADDRDRLFPNSLEWEVYSTTGTVQLSSLMSVNRGEC